MYKEEAARFMAMAMVAQKEADEYEKQIDEMIKRGTSPTTIAVIADGGVIHVSSNVSADNKDVDLSSEDSVIVDELLETLNGSTPSFDPSQIIPAMTTWSKMISSNISATAITKMKPIVTGFFKKAYPNLTTFISTQKTDDLVSLESEIRTINNRLSGLIPILDKMLPISLFIERFRSWHPEIYAALV